MKYRFTRKEFEKMSREVAARLGCPQAGDVPSKPYKAQIESVVFDPFTKPRGKRKENWGRERKVSRKQLRRMSSF